MTKLQNMRIVDIPAFRALSSGELTLERLFDSADCFARWVEEHRHLLRNHLFEPQDFLWHEECDVNRSVWIHAVREGVTETDTAPYDIIDFPGGLFLVATADERDKADLNETVAQMFQWIEESAVFTYGDFPKSGMCNMPNPDGRADMAMGIAQQQIFLPLKLRKTADT